MYVRNYLYYKLRFKIRFKNKILPIENSLESLEKVNLKTISSQKNSAVILRGNSINYVIRSITQHYITQPT